MLHEIADAPPNPGEHHHPVRLFIGAGMPRGLWRRVDRRFAPARVLEFYASTEGDAILVNLTGEKPGCKGRPLPGSAEVRLAAYDIDAGRLLERADGFAIECRARRGRDAAGPAARASSRPGRARCAASSSPTTPGSRPATCSAPTTTATSGSSTTSRR